MTNDADHDAEFEAFLRRRSPMHRRLSQIDHAEPSAELDRLVLDRARDAIRVPSAEPIYRKPRWAMPVGLAATILIAFTVVLKIDHRRAGPSGPDAQTASAARLADAQGTAPFAPLVQRARPESAAADVSAFDAALEPNPPPAPAAAPPAESVGMTARGFAESRAKAERDEASVAARDSDARTDNAAEIVARRDRALASSGSAAVVNPAPISGAAEPGAAAAAKRVEAPVAAASTAATASTSVQAAGDITAAPAPRPAGDPHASPEAWLQEINRLRAEGKNEEADRELAAFRRAHPAHPGYSLAQPPTR